jgi:hypothetical protein
VPDLGLYDLIIGMDWPEVFSPMKVHWEQKYMLILYDLVQIALQGLNPETAACSVIQLYHVASDAALPQPAIQPKLQSLLDEFTALFFRTDSSPTAATR